MTVIRFCKNIIEVINLQILNDLCLSLIRINPIFLSLFLFSLQMSKLVEKFIYSFIKPLLVSNLLSFRCSIHGR